MSIKDTTTTFNTVPYHEQIRVELVELESEKVRLRVPFKEENSNPGGALHGGIAGSLVNIAARQLATSHIEEPADAFDVSIVSQDVQYLSAAISEPVEAIGKILRRGKGIAFIEVDVIKQQNKEVAKGIVTIRCVPKGTDAIIVNPPTLTAQSFHPGPYDPGEMSGAFTSSGFIHELGLCIEHMKDGSAIVKMPHHYKLSEIDGSYHGGALVALIDNAGAMASWSVVSLGMHKASTPAIHVNFLKPARVPSVQAFARLRWQREELFLNEVHVVDPDTGTIYAEGSVVYRIVINQ